MQSGRVSSFPASGPIRAGEATASGGDTQDIDIAPDWKARSTSALPTLARNCGEARCGDKRSYYKSSARDFEKLMFGPWFEKWIELDSDQWRREDTTTTL